MKHLAKILLVGLVSAILAGCATAKKDAELPPPPYITTAVMQSMDNMFSGSWAGVKIYIERTKLLPVSVDKVGLNVAEMIDKESLIRRYQYDRVAPAMAFINAYEDDTRVIHVVINYRPVKIPDTKPATKGGEFRYTFKRRGGKLIMLTSTSAVD